VTSDIVARGMFVAGTAAVINRLEDAGTSAASGALPVEAQRRSVSTAMRLHRLDVIALGKLKMQFLERS